MRKTLFLLATSLIITLSAIAQQPGYITEGTLLDGKSIIKASITTPFFNTFSFSGERILNKRMSAIIGVSFMPAGPFLYIDKISDIDQQTHNLISGARLNTFSFSPELRIYTGRGYGRGFYVSPYYRYERFGLDNLSIELTLGSMSEDIVMQGKVNTHSAGLMFGYQWLLGRNRNIVIDWTMLGVHYGTSSGNFEGRYDGDTPMTEAYRKEAEETIDTIFEDLPFIKAKSTVREDNSAQVSITGPWAFVRGGISVGFRF